MKIIKEALLEIKEKNIELLREETLIYKLYEDLVALLGSLLIKIKK